MVEKFRLRLIQEIKNSGMTTVEMAHKLGISQSVVSDYVNARKLPSFETFIKLCKLLKCSSDYLLGIED